MAPANSVALSARRVLGATAGAISPGVVRIADGAIQEVSTFEGGDPEFEILAPGFVDLQCNGVGPVDVAVAEGQDWEVISRTLLSHGVTTWCPTLVTAPDDDTDAAIARIRAARSATGATTPEIAGVHLEGPYITVLGAHRADHARMAVEPGLAATLDPLVRIVTLAPELPGAMDAIASLCEAGVVVSLGHSACTAEQAHTAASAGARLVTHLGNATGAFHQRSPGLLGAGLTDDGLTVGLIADLEHLHPDVLKLAFASKGSNRVVLVSDSVATAAATVGPVELDARIPEGSAARLVDGTLAGSALSMERAVSNCVRFAGVRLEDAVGSASRVPSRVLGLSDRGEIAPGMRADLVALNWSAATEQLSVEAVWVGGLRAWPDPGGDMPAR